MRDITSEEDGYISLEAEGTAAVVDDGDDETEDEMMLEDICEVVISLKCKQCQFLCNDKSTLATHIKQTHSQKRAKESNKRKAERNENGEKNPEKLHSYEDDYDCEPSSNADKVKAHDKSESCGAAKEDSNSQERNRNKESSRGTEENADSPPTLESNHFKRSSPSSPDNEISSESLPVESVLEEPVEDVFLCAECDIVFSSREMCCSHMHKVHGLKQFSADFIQEEIISKPAEEAQNSKRGRKTKFPKQYTAESGTIVPKKYRVTKDVFHMCSKCSIKFESAEVMKFHEQCHVPTTTNNVANRNPQQIIKKDATLVEGYNNDCMATEECLASQKGFTCPVCESNGVGPQSFPKWGPCSWHLWKEHRIDCELYTCSVCKQFKSHLIARVKDHEQLHSTKASYKCKTCNKSFKQMKQLRCHEKYHKDNSTKLAPEHDSRWYTPKECPICKRVLSDSKCLKKHISAVHNKLKPYVCNICGHTSARKAELKLHIRQHTGEKPYKCSLCTFQTGDHNSLRKHKLRHSDKRPYACSYCDYRCIQSCAFKKHILACHPGQEVVFLCQLCSHASVNATLFIAHQQDHAEGRISTENQDETDGNSTMDKRRSPSPSTSNDCESNSNGGVGKFWSGDEDSLDIIDNGGVTIPASPPTPMETNNADTQGAAAADTLPHRVVSESSAAETYKNAKTTSEIAPATRDVFLSGSAVNKSNHRESLILFKPSSTCSNGKKPSLQQDRQFLVPQGFCVATSSPLHSLPLPPRQEKSNTLISTSSTNTSEDTESSSSEVITNPHQLIQNIQLTPLDLDLTDIISCNEQSNDDGMLQRLLDMSGV